MWARVGEELECDDEDLRMLRVAASRRHGHATGLWAPGHPMPAEDKQDWLVLAGFDSSPYEPDEQGAAYLFGDVRMFVLSPTDILGPARGLLGADLPSLGYALYRLRASGGFTMDPMTEDDLVEALAEECRRVLAQVGAGGGEREGDEDDDTECEACGAQTRLWTDPDRSDPDSELERQPAAKFCANCGAQIPIPAEVVS